MKMIKPRISIMCNTDYENGNYVKIELRDALASSNLFEIKLTGEQFIAALSRLDRVECDVEFYPISLSRINKQQIVVPLTFEISEEIYNDYRNRKSLCTDIAEELVQGTEWESDNYFVSQDSFFRKDGKCYAKTVKRTWIDPEEEVTKET